MFVAGGEAFVAGSDGTTWNHWTGTGWSQETIPWPAPLDPAKTTLFGAHAVIDLADGTVLLVAANAGANYLMTFDGTSISVPLEVPSTLYPYQAETVAFTHTSDGSYWYRYWWQGAPTLYRGDPVSGWGTGTPIPVVPGYSPSSPGALVATTSGRIVLSYLATNPAVSGAATHLHVLSLQPGSAWSPDLDITHDWAVNATWPLMAAARGGGVVIAATGASKYYTVPTVWRSSDGSSFGPSEEMSSNLNRTIYSVSAECIDSPLVVAANRGNEPESDYATSIELWTRTSNTWGMISSVPPILSILAASTTAVQLSDGRTFWGIGYGENATTGAAGEYDFFATLP
jgi:hypothetical protein